MRWALRINPSSTIRFDRGHKHFENKRVISMELPELKHRLLGLDTQIDVECGGVTITPGDMLYGDNDGIVVATMRELTDLLPAVELIQNNEKRIIAAVRRGQSLFERLGFHDHQERIRQGQDSKLTYPPRR